MGHIYWELHEIPIPEGSHINHNDGRVFLMSDDGLGRSKRRVIGRATSETTMHPNDLYKFLYPTLWEEYYNEKSFPAHELHLGMYMLTLGIGYAKNLYHTIHDVYGPLYGNAIMDYAMYSIMDRSDTTQLFEDRMSREVLFSKEAYSDSWYSELFKQHMPEDANHQFRSLWIEECQKRGITDVWLSIDGSNSDCSMKQGDLAEKGKAKSHNNGNIVSYIWAVDAATGLPVTYNVNHGGMVDAKALQKTAAVLKDAGISIKGIILDRGFCTYDVISLLKECKYPYILMMKSDSYGHQQMVLEHAEKIRWNVSNVVADTGIFGFRSTGKLFKAHPDKAQLYLYYDGMNGADRSVTLIKKVLKASEAMRAEIAAGKKPCVPKGMGAYLEVGKNNKDSYTVVCKEDAWQEAINGKGFYTIASSEELTPSVIHALYHLRDASEKQFMVMKTQLGFRVSRVHTEEGLRGKCAVCFIAAILRNELMNACKEQGLDTNRMLREIDRISLVLMTDGSYTAINNLSIRQKQLLSCFNIIPENLKPFADDVNRRLMNPINSQFHQIPNTEGNSIRKRPGRPPKQKEITEEQKPKRGPGRPKGSKNKKTLERESLKTTETVKRKPGRPKGSKNKKTLEREAMEQMDTLKRGPGRPKGSKNKKTLEKEALLNQPEKRKPGRPKGSKNRSKI